MKTHYIITLILMTFISSCKKKLEVSNCSIDHPYKFTSEIQKKLEADSTIWKHEPAAWDYSRIGDYKNALAQWEKSREALYNSFGYIDKDSINPEVVLNNYAFVDAKSFILNEARNYQVLIINEAHHHPRDRAFTAGLLPELKKLGYHSIGYEAAADSISTLNDYPNRGLGFYTEEPQFGELIRTALQLGFNQFAYDDDGDLQGDDREKYQAEKISEHLIKNPDSKIIVHCGFGHLKEDEYSRTMGYYLKTLYDIDPLTISQTRYTEQNSKKTEQEIYRDIDISQPSILVDKNNQVFNKGQTTAPEIDIQVFHPRTTWLSGRPDWLEYNGKDY